MSEPREAVLPHRPRHGPFLPPGIVELVLRHGAAVVRHLASRAERVRMREVSGVRLVMGQVTATQGHHAQRPARAVMLAHRLAGGVVERLRISATDVFLHPLPQGIINVARGRAIVDGFHPAFRVPLIGVAPRAGPVLREVSRRIVFVVRVREPVRRLIERPVRARAVRLRIGHADHIASSIPRRIRWRQPKSFAHTAATAMSGPPEMEEAPPPESCIARTR